MGHAPSFALLERILPPGFIRMLSQPATKKLVSSYLPTYLPTYLPRHMYQEIVFYENLMFIFWSVWSVVCLDDGKL
jgi:hypothetical protein